MHACADLVPHRIALVSDEELHGRLLDHDERAWTELFRRFRPLILSCIHRTALRRGERLSEDERLEVYSELCCQLVQGDLRRIRAWDPARGSKLSTWMGLLASHATSDYLRARRRRPRSEPLDTLPEPVATDPDALESVLGHERKTRLRALLAGCSATDRRFVELYYAQGLLPEEVATAMRISVKTVYSKKHKLGTRLRSLACRAA